MEFWFGSRKGKAAEEMGSGRENAAGENGHMGGMASSKEKSAEGYPDQTNEEKLSKMRKAVEGRGCSLQGVDDATLLRFLRARSMAVEKAAKMFVQSKSWRASFMPQGYIPDEEVANELASKKVYLQGTSRQGWPIVVGISRNHDASNRSLEEFKRFLAHALDKLISSAAPGVEKMLVIIDLEHISYKNVDVRGAIAGFTLLQSYYPERLGRLYMVNVPHMFMQFWKAIRRFVDEETERKVGILAGILDGSLHGKSGMCWHPAWQESCHALEVCNTQKCGGKSPGNLNFCWMFSSRHFLAFGGLEDYLPRKLSAIAM